MEGYGNSIIDGDDGSHHQSPDFIGENPVITIFDDYWWNEDDGEWVLDSRKELENVKVSKESLISLMKERGVKFDKKNMYVLKNECDHVKIKHNIAIGEEIQYELYYE